MTALLAAPLAASQMKTGLAATGLARALLHMLTSLLLSALCYQSNAFATVLVAEDDPPYNMLRDGKIVGVSTEKLEEAFRRADLPFRIEIKPWIRAYSEALSNPDYCVFSTARTNERESLFQWIGPIAKSNWVLYTRADNPVRPKSIDDIKDHVIGGYLGDVISLWLSSHGFQIDTAASDRSNPRKLINGRFDYWAASQTSAEQLLRDQKLDGKIVPLFVFGHNDLYLACNAAITQEKATHLNEVLRQMQTDGTSARIDSRYSRLLP